MAEPVLNAVTAVVALLLTEIQAGDGLSFSAAAREFPGHRGVGRLNPSTVHRWAHKGVRGANGGLIKLAAVRIGSRWLTTRGAVARFAADIVATGLSISQGLCTLERTTDAGPVLMDREVMGW